MNIWHARHDLGTYNSCTKIKEKFSKYIYFWLFVMVGATGIEPVTPAVARQCSTAELRTLKNL